VSAAVDAPPASAAGRSLRRRRRALAGAVALVVVGGLAVGCSGGDGEAARDEAATETLPPTTLVSTESCDVAMAEAAEELPDGVAPGIAPTLPAGVDTGYVGEGLGSGNPYLVPGARPVPGPDLTVTTIGAEPLTLGVAVPPNPDVGTPAVTPEGLQTLPRPPTTLPPAATSTTAPVAASTTEPALMSLADDPGCVARRGDP
jgi:hypothetical protein